MLVTKAQARFSPVPPVNTALARMRRPASTFTARVQRTAPRLTQHWQLASKGNSPTWIRRNHPPPGSQGVCNASAHSVCVEPQSNHTKVDSNTGTFGQVHIIPHSPSSSRRVSPRPARQKSMTYISPHAPYVQPQRSTLRRPPMYTPVRSKPSPRHPTHYRTPTHRNAPLLVKSGACADELTASLTIAQRPSSPRPPPAPTPVLIATCSTEYVVPAESQEVLSALESSIPETWSEADKRHMVDQVACFEKRHRTFTCNAARALTASRIAPPSSRERAAFEKALVHIQRNRLFVPAEAAVSTAADSVGKARVGRSAPQRRAGHRAGHVIDPTGADGKSWTLVGRSSSQI